MIAIIDYKAGNLISVERAVKHIGADCIITSDPAQIAASDRIIFPGVGAAGSAMESLARLQLDKSLSFAFKENKPILGICLGSQIILEQSEEQNTSCLGLIPGKVVSFLDNMEDENNISLKVPHMGWNTISLKTSHPVLKDINTDNSFYFVHSYYPVPTKTAHILAETTYGISFASILGFKNLIATQFHPEKSGAIGLQLLKNFLQWTPSI